MCVQITKKASVKFNTDLLQGHYGGPEVQSPFSFLIFRSCSFVPRISRLPSFARPISRLSFLVLYLPFVVSPSPFLVRRFSFSISRSPFLILHFSFVHGGPEVQTPFSFLVFPSCSLYGSRERHLQFAFSFTFTFAFTMFFFRFAHSLSFFVTQQVNACLSKQSMIGRHYV